MTGVWIMPIWNAVLHHRPEYGVVLFGVCQEVHGIGPRVLSG